ncbi:MAG: inositol monophosphatase [Nanoarchaeota archaeon]|nr:inositol monophosphatase [Nanoarchaeota archaeon]
MMYSKELKTAIKAAYAAGKISLKYFEKKHSVKDKGSDGLVTEIDIKCESKIISILKRSFPSHSILSEEIGFIDNKSEYCWAIDPIDGTHNYIYGLPFFGVSIALMKDYKPITGVIYLPYFDELYFAEKGKGAYLIKNNKKNKLSVSDRTKNINVLYMCTFLKEKQGRLRLFNKIMKKLTEIRMLGCAVFDLAYIASGKIDGKIIPKTNAWDVAAGFLLIEEAGGEITYFNGKAYNLKDCKELIVSNKRIHKKLLKLVK